MLRWAANGAREGDWIIAEKQTAGRGRQGREWISPAGNFYGSTLVKLRDGDPPAATLALVAAIAAHCVLSSLIHFTRADIERHPGSLIIKWPNDILYDQAKIAGILLERARNHVVIGVGLNLQMSPSALGRTTSSVFEITGEHQDPKTLYWGGLGSRFFETLQIWRWREKGGLGAIREQWLKRAHPIGTSLRTETPDGQTLEGSFYGLSEEGGLQLRLADGSIRLIHAGDVFLVQD